MFAAISDFRPLKTIVNQRIHKSVHALLSEGAVPSRGYRTNSGDDDFVS